MKRRYFIKHILIGISTGALGLLSPGVEPVRSAGRRFPKPDKKDRCPVCGMFVHKFPKWAAGLVFDNGSMYFHCSPKCMLHNLNNIAKYQPGEERRNLKLIWATDYYTTKKMDARELFFVTGTNLLGPMGLDLVPVRGRNAADNLKADYKGESVLSLEQITPAVIEAARKGRLRK
ncbi:nitrous oxide reductase accessory protein NosL [Thermodesulfobacteriota bacterium]